MSELELKALAIDFTALQAVVRALVRAQSRRSQGHLLDLMESLRVESERLARFPTDDFGHRAAQGLLEAWIDELRNETVGD